MKAIFPRHYWTLASGIAAVAVIAIGVSKLIEPTAPPSRTKKIKEPQPRKIQPDMSLSPPHAEVVHKKAHRKQAKNNVPRQQVLSMDFTLSSINDKQQALAAPVVAKSCFEINNIVLEVPEHLPQRLIAAGASALPTDNFRFAQDELDTHAHAGKCIGRDELNDIIKKLTALVLAKGYTTTRLGIPEQNLSNGTLKITLIPGVIRNIRFEPEDASGSWKTAFPARPGDLLNLRDFEQGLEQMKRVPSQDVDMQIVPGAQPGESDVVINIKRGRDWKWTATLDDSGSNGTGKYQSSLNLSLDNPLGINDLFNMGINNDAGNRGGNRGTRGNNAYYSVPYGNWTFTLAGSAYQYHQRIAGTYQTFVSSGESNNLELKMAYLLHRDQNSKTSIQARTAKRWNSSFIDDTEIAVQRRNTTMAELAIVHKHNIGTAQLEVTAAQRAGVHWFGAQQDLENRLATDPTFFYEMSVLDIALTVPFSIANRPVKYIHTLRAQSSESSLFATEYISMGNRWTVRGFDGESSLAAERGWFIRNELETPIAQSPHSIYLGLDMGMVYGNNVPNLVGDHLAGAAIGLRGSPFKGFYYDIFSGWPLYKPEKYPTAQPAAGFSLNYQF